MEEILIKKHWFCLLKPFFIGFILAPCGIGFLVWLWAFLRFKKDTIKIENQQLCSRFGLINIDTKLIPLNKISFVSVSSDIISKAIGFGCLTIKSSAFNSDISYRYICNAEQIAKVLNEKNL